MNLLGTLLTGAVSGAAGALVGGWIARRNELPYPPTPEPPEPSGPPDVIPVASQTASGPATAAGTSAQPIGSVQIDLWGIFHAFGVYFPAAGCASVTPIIDAGPYEVLPYRMAQRIATHWNHGRTPEAILAAATKACDNGQPTPENFFVLQYVRSVGT